MLRQTHESSLSIYIPYGLCSLWQEGIEQASKHSDETIN